MWCVVRLLWLSSTTQKTLQVIARMVLPHCKDLSCPGAFSADGDVKAIVRNINHPDKLDGLFSREIACHREVKWTMCQPGVLVWDSTMDTSSLICCLMSSSATRGFSSHAHRLNVTE